MIATSQVANTVANLKSRYYKYLETLCTANGVDIGTLKTNGSEYEELEMFFGGLPVLIGLKYFEKLKILRLFGQDIVNLKPLVEISETLEELWICEGPLKDLSGIDMCRKLRKVFLYDCKIEDGSLLGKLPGIDSLWIQNNNLKDFSFLDNLQQLTILQIGGKQFNDHTALTVQTWPHKLQELDCNANSVISLQSLLPLSNCEIIRCLNLSSDFETNLIFDETHFSWIGFHFPYLERLNNDIIGEKFHQNNLIFAENIFMENYVKFVNGEKNYYGKINLIDKNCQKIHEKLSMLTTTLLKLALTVPKKEGRRELVIRMQEQSQKSLKTLKSVKRQCLMMEYYLHRLHDYYFASWKLEGAMPSTWPRHLDDYEIRLLEHSFKWFGSKSTEYEVKIHAAYDFDRSSDAFTKLKRADVEQLFFMDFDRRSVLWDLRSCVALVDSRFTKDYREDTVRIFKDIAVFTNESKETTRFLILPMVKCEKHGRKFRLNGKTDILGENDEKKEIKDDEEANIVDENENESFANKGQIESSNWNQLEFSLICLVEIQPMGQVLFEDFRNSITFDEKFGAQIKKLKGLGIDIKLEKSQNLTEPGGNLESQPSDLTEEQVGEKKSKGKKVEDLITSDFGRNRWRKQMIFNSNKRLTLRDPLELALTFGKPSIFVDSVDLIATITTLDLSDMKLTKLDGIEQMNNLVCLSVANNKLISLKKLKPLRNLHFLNASSNNLSHFDDPPEMLTEINLSSNQFTDIHFCGKLQLLTKIIINNNKIKTLKGIENAKSMEIFRASENLIKEKFDLEILHVFQKLIILDLSNNPITEVDYYRKIVLQKCPSLLLIDGETIPKEERQLAIRKPGPGKALTIDFIEKNYPNFDSCKILNLQRNGFQMIALDRQAISRLQHLKELNFCENSLETLHELINLTNLECLNLSKNSIITLTGIPIIRDSQQNKNQILVSLTELDLSFNNLTSQTLSRLGLTLLPLLKKLILKGNQITKFDLAVFDLKNLEELDLSQNDLKSIKKKTLPQLKWLNLAQNKLKDLEGLSTPNLIYLDIRNNKILTCSSLKPISLMPNLKKFYCSGNGVTERRVYQDFIRNQVKSLEFHDDEALPQPQLSIPQKTTNIQHEVSNISNESTSTSTIEKINQFQKKNSFGINIRIAEPIFGEKNLWQPSTKEPIRTTGRPLYCPPKSSIVVNRRISNNSGNYSMFFPEGHYLKEDGTLEITPISTSPIMPYGSMPQLSKISKIKNPPPMRKNNSSILVMSKNHVFHPTKTNFDHSFFISGEKYDNIFVLRTNGANF